MIASACDRYQINLSSNPTFIIAMSLANNLQRRVKPRKYDSDDDEASSVQQESGFEKSHFDDSLSSNDSSEDSKSQQQHQTDGAGTEHESVRRIPLHLEQDLLDKSSNDPTSVRLRD